ncbi:MAG: PAS domain-containing protein [bacterium]|nr:PAS domain-containing protein [bacterium]
MMAFLMVKLLAVIVSIVLGAGILARDHELKANRLIAAFLFCNAWWAGVEFFLYQAQDVLHAERLYRAMGLGSIPLGVLCAHVSVSLSSMEDHPVGRLIGPCYVAMILLLPFSLATDWVVAGAEKTTLGWRAIFGPGMFVVYLFLAAPVMGVISCWRGILRLEDRDGQLQLAGVIFFGITAALVTGTLTEIVLPLLRVDAVGVTTSLVSFTGLAGAWTLRRFGHSLISPEAFAREILDTLEDGIVLVGEGGILRDANRAFLRLIGVRACDALGQPVSRWIPAFPERLDAAESGSSVELVSRSGDSLPIVLSEPVACMGGGQLVGHAFLVRDRREIVSLQRQLVVSARLAAVGDLAKSISESINEPIARVRDEFDGLSLDWLRAEEILERAGSKEDCHEAIAEGKELIEECAEGIDRIQSIVCEVAGISNEKERDEFMPHALEQIVRRAVRVAQVQAPEGLVIETHLDPNVMIVCHAAELERVVINLLVNALQALDGCTPGQGHLVVAAAAEGRRAFIHIEDDGCGIEDEAIDRIFDPFFTTKPVGEGTGLGLAISHHIVKAHGGGIRVSSVPGRGTSVAVELPRVPLEVD